MGELCVCLALVLQLSDLVFDAVSQSGCGQGERRVPTEKTVDQLTSNRAAR